MKQKICRTVNFFYSIVCLVLFLIQNGIVIIPGTTENKGIYAKQYTESFLLIFRIVIFIVAIIGIGIVVFDFMIQKELTAINKVGCIIGLCAICFTIMSVLFLEAIPITCVLGLAAYFMMMIKVK